MCSLLICKPFSSNIVRSSKPLNICRATPFLGLDMCGHSCCLGSKESHFVGYADGIGAGIVRFLLLSAVDGGSNWSLSKDLSQESLLLLRLRNLQSQATFWIRGKYWVVTILAKIGYWSLRLHVRSSTVFGVFIFFGSFFFGLGLGYRPEMAFVLYFALTFMDAILTFNPCKLHFPAWIQQLVWHWSALVIPRPSYYSAHTFVVAAAVYVAISIASQIIIFPESYNHSWLWVFPWFCVRLKLTQMIILVKKFGKMYYWYVSSPTLPCSPSNWHSI